MTFADVMELIKQHTDRISYIGYPLAIAAIVFIAIAAVKAAKSNVSIKY